MHSMSWYLIASAACAVAVAGIVSCAADPRNSMKSTPTDENSYASSDSPAADSSASTESPTPTPGATNRYGNRKDLPVSNFPPDTTNYTRPLR